MTLELAGRDGDVLAEELLSRHTTLRIGGPARWYCRVRTAEGLSRVLGAACDTGEPLALLGMGSNVLAADDGFPGWVVRLEGDFLRIAIEGERLTAGGGAALGGACAAAARAGLSGLEPIFGIPSSIGGAVRINAGARANGLSYNQFMAGLKAANVELDRKVLADLAVADPAKFGEFVEQAKSALARQ